jgi:hypothetical protein
MITNLKRQINWLLLVKNVGKYFEKMLLILNNLMNIALIVIINMFLMLLPRMIDEKLRNWDDDFVLMILFKNFVVIFLIYINK